MAFFICYAPMYFQRLLLAIFTLNGGIEIQSVNLTSAMAYLYILSGLTFYFGTAINPILYNILSNKYRRAFRNLCCCRFRRSSRKSSLTRRTHQLTPAKANFCLIKEQKAWPSPLNNLCPPIKNRSI